MSDEQGSAERARWSRPALGRMGPDRRPGGFYRSAEGKAQSLGGVPLVEVEDAVVAAVRLAYQVAEAQVDRSARLARRLREAGDRAGGPGSDRRALDATERLIFRTLMSSLGWLESAAAEPGSPLRRAASAQYRLWGSLFGIADAPPSADGKRPGEAGEGGERPAKRARPDDAGEGQERAAKRARPRGQELPARAPGLQIVLLGPHRRAVKVVGWQVAAAGPLREEVVFYSSERVRSPALRGELAIEDDGRARLVLETPRLAASGRWKAAVCDAAGVQLGVIEIRL